MSTTELTRDAVGGTSMSLRFKLTAAEGSAFTRQLLRSRRSVWMIVLTRVAALGMGYFAVDFALEGQWLIAVLTAYVAVSTWSQHLTMLWLMRIIFGDTTTRAELELDSNGVRGEFEYESTRGWGNGRKRISYTWNRLRKVEHLPDYVLFEFHGGSGAIIPVSAFAEPDDLRLCEAWAENGLAQGRKKPT